MQMNNKIPADLAQDLFQVVKQFPRMRLMKTTSEGFKRREYDLLVLLSINLDTDKRALSVSELSHLLQITPAGVTHLLNPLEEMGCIERLRDPKDRRVVLIGLTDKGLGIADDLVAGAQEKLIGLIEYLGEEDARTLVRLMLKMVAYLSE
jgi:DNA-binding MarR family transcriptional regulator